MLGDPTVYIFSGFYCVNFICDLVCYILKVCETVECDFLFFYLLCFTPQGGAPIYRRDLQTEQQNLNKHIFLIFASFRSRLSDVVYNLHAHTVCSILNVSHNFSSMHIPWVRFTHHHFKQEKASLKNCEKRNPAHLHYLHHYMYLLIFS